jgi:hypothetical protein
VNGPSSQNGTFRLEVLSSCANEWAQDRENIHAIKNIRKLTPSDGMDGVMRERVKANSVSHDGIRA